MLRNGKEPYIVEFVQEQNIKHVKVRRSILQIRYKPRKKHKDTRTETKAKKI